MAIDRELVVVREKVIGPRVRDTENAPLQRAQDPPLLAGRCVHAAPSSLLKQKLLLYLVPDPMPCLL